MTVASARSSTSSEPARFSGGALDVGVTGSARLALVLDVAGTPRPAFVLEIAVLSALTLALTIAVFTRDCYTWHLQRCISLDYISNCFLIVMRPIERARRDPRGLFKRTAARATGSAPWQTTANSARPSSTRSVHVSGPVISTTVLTQRTRTQPLPLSTIQVYFQVVRQWARREPSGGISAADAGAASMWQWIYLNTEEHLAPKLPSAGSGPSGPLNKPFPPLLACLGVPHPCWPCGWLAPCVSLAGVTVVVNFKLNRI